MKCYSRVLHPTWANAVADHWKPFEAQKYAGCNRNAMKFPTDDSDREKVVIIGAKGENAVTAVAKVYSVVRNISAHHMQQLKYALPVGLIEKLDQYMEGGTCYDVLLFSQIYEIRSEKLSWVANPWQQNQSKLWVCEDSWFGWKPLGGPLQRIWLRVHTLQTLL